jgi:hypothetical protein
MKPFFTSLLLAFTATLGACSAPVKVGEPESEVIAKRGQPTHRYQDGQDRLLEYATGPFGQRTYMARIGPDDRLVSFNQVLTVEKFGSLNIGQATKKDVLLTVGAPSETSYLSLSDLEVWSYPYKESEAWNSIMHIHFDRTGIVRKLWSGPDLRFEPDGRFPFLMFGR